MKTSKKIILFLSITLVLGATTYLIINNLNKKKGSEDENNSDGAAIIEDIDYSKYMVLRSKAHEKETYAIMIWNSKDSISIEYLDEIKIAFENRKSSVYLLDRSKLSDEDFSRVIDDVTEIMNYKKPEITIPMLIVMSKGEIIYKHVGLIYKEELIENLNSKSIE